MSKHVEFVNQLPDTVTILRPMPSVSPRGQAAKTRQQPTVTIRFPQDHKDMFHEAADLLGMSASKFIDWCAYNVANDILTKKVEYDRRNRKR